MSGKNLDSSVFDWTSDAAARTVIANLIAQITAVTAAGYVTQTTDTGQVNTATYTRPGTNTFNAYIILKSTDSLSGSAPVYMRIDFGTGASASVMNMRTSYGPSTDGAGNLTGAWSSSSNVILRALAATSTVTSYPTYMCSTDFGFGFGFKLGASATNGGSGFAGFARPCNADGSVRSDAIITFGWNSASSFPWFEIINFATAVKYGGLTNAAVCLIPNSALASLVGTSFQYFEHRYVTPTVVSTNFLCSLFGTEVGLGVQNAATLNGVAPANTHNYVSLGSGTVTTGLVGAGVGFAGGVASTITSATIGMVYE